MIDFEELNEFVGKCGPNTKLYVGCDSGAFKKHGIPMAVFTLAIVVHIDGKHGGRLFYENVTERDFSVSKNKPSPRLMMEVHKVSELYLTMLEKCENVLDKSVEIHIDFNPIEDHFSSTVIKEAIGYVRGVCQVDPVVKPAAFAASTIADRFH
jgi:predicted RNase H-related nuclease YkuK (DUF458 family)